MIKTILIITRYFINIIIHFWFIVSAMPPPNPKENIIYFSSDWRMSAVIVKDVLIVLHQNRRRINLFQWL